MTSTKLSPQLPDPKHPDLPAAHSLQDAVNSNDSLQGYAAMNDPKGESEIAQYAIHHPADERHEIARLAYHYYEERGGQDGSADEDWLRAENAIHSRQQRNR